VKTYLFIHQTRTDGNILIEKKSADEIRAFIKDRGLTRFDYAIADGEVLKSFDNQIDLKQL
jgi:hypothetical protein